jgi:hypothetical protein
LDHFEGEAVIQAMAWRRHSPDRPDADRVLGRT